MTNELLSPEKFQRDTLSALNNPQLRRNFKRAMGGLMEKRQAVFADGEEWQQLRELGRSIRANALRKLPDLLEKLESNCRKNGIQVHWAESIAEANALVLEIAQRHQVKSVVKGKSMVSEEMELNHFLEQHGIEALEADLGEYIIQVDHELPSHIIMPAIHKNKDQIAQMFHEKVDPEAHAETAEEMTALARKVLRQKFYEADMGVSGVNFAVAETGTLCLVENEGNGRFCTTLPPVHVAVMGIEKVVERFEDVPPLLSLLTRSGIESEYSVEGGVDFLRDYAWFRENSGGIIHATGQKISNPNGLFDLHGNVWEWVYDWFGIYPNLNSTNPQGPEIGKYRILRGGSWSDPAEYLRSAMRRDALPTSTYNNVGFRCASKK